METSTCIVIYCITVKNKYNCKEKRYIGQSKHPQDRWETHCQEAQKSDPALIVNDAMKKHGAENCSFRIVDFAFTKHQANCLENGWMDRLDTMIYNGNGYNVHRAGGTYRTDFGDKHWTHRPENADKVKAIGDRNRKMMAEGTWQPPIHNMPHTEEAKAKMSAAKLANPTNSWINHTEEEKQQRLDNLYDAGFGNTDLKGEKHPMFGKTHTEEAKSKIKEARAKQVMQPLNAERKEKLRIANTGRKPSESTRQKMSEAAKKRMANRPRKSNGQF